MIELACWQIEVESRDDFGAQRLVGCDNDRVVDVPNLAERGSDSAVAVGTVKQQQRRPAREQQRWTKHGTEATPPASLTVCSTNCTNMGLSLPSPSLRMMRCERTRRANKMRAETAQILSSPQQELQGAKDQTRKEENKLRVRSRVKPSPSAGWQNLNSPFVQQKTRSVSAQVLSRKINLIQSNLQQFEFLSINLVD